MRRKGHPSLPSAITCCFFSSLKTLLMLTEAISPLVSVNVPGFIVGRFSGDPHWPVLGDPLGRPRPNSQSGYKRDLFSIEGRTVLLKRFYYPQQTIPKKLWTFVAVRC